MHTPGVDEGVEVARRVFAAFADGDVEAALELADEDVEFLPVTANLTTGGLPYRGHEGIVRYFADAARVWSELRAEPTEFRQAGDSVVALGRIYARGGGMVIDRPAGWVWRLRAGKITWGRVYASHEEALAAVGLLE